MKNNVVSFLGRRPDIESMINPEMEFTELLHFKIVCY